MKRAISILLALVSLTAAYIYAWPSATVLYFAAVILHVLGGAALLLLLVCTLRNIFRSAPPAKKIGWLLLTLGGILGVALIFTGTRRNEWPLLYAHIAACVAGAALVAACWAGRRGFLAGSRSAGLARWALSLASAAALFAGANWLRTVPWERSHQIENPAIAPDSMDNEGDGPS